MNANEHQLLCWQSHPRNDYTSPMNTRLLQMTAEGLYCPIGDFHIDPWRGVPRAVITHAHSDHAVWGCEHYLISRSGRRVFETRISNAPSITELEYGEKLLHNGVQITLHPAGHILGSSQIRLEYQGEVVVVSGDYKLDADSTCRCFEAVKCHRFVTESTFGLPIYRWQKPQDTFDEINAWWRSNRERGVCSIVYAYSLGKAQRLLAGIDSSIGPILVHGAVEKLNRAYRESGVLLPETLTIAEVPEKKKYAGSLVIAPPSAETASWVKKFDPSSEAVASGWMAVRGIRRRRAVDRGFVLSDHADWPGLNEAVKATEAEEVYVTHGYAETFSRWLREQGIQASVLPTRFHGETPTPVAGETT
jgi:putative mRNA 3-end processing factor